MGLTRLTHKRESGMKSGYWSPNRKEELVERLAEYEDLGEQGKLLKLPCAVGDAVYEICEGFIEPCTVETIFLADYKDKAGNPSYMMEIYYDREDCPWVSTEIYFTDIGKTVFLTREEAEAALKELRRGKHERAGKDLDSG